MADEWVWLMTDFFPYLDGKYSASKLLTQIAEHRLLTTRLVLFIDAIFFDLRGLFPSTVTYLSLASIAFMLVRLAVQPATVPVQAAAFLILLAITWSTSQYFNLTWSYQVQFPLVHLFALGALWSFAIAVTTEDNVRYAWLALALICDFLAIWSAGERPFFDGVISPHCHLVGQQPVGGDLLPDSPLDRHSLSNRLQVGGHTQRTSRLSRMGTVPGANYPFCRMAVPLVVVSGRADCNTLRFGGVPVPGDLRNGQVFSSTCRLGPQPMHPAGVCSLRADRGLTLRLHTADSPRPPCDNADNVCRGNPCCALALRGPVASGRPSLVRAGSGHADHLHFEPGKV